MQHDTLQKRRVVFLDDDTWRLLTDRAHASGTTRSDIIRQSLTHVPVNTIDSRATERIRPGEPRREEAFGAFLPVPKPSSRRGR